MRKDYENSLKMMMQGDEDLAVIIKNFVDRFPPSLVKKINESKRKGIVISEDRRWIFEDNGKEFSISLGGSGNSNKDYMSMYLASTPDEKLKNWPKFEGEKLVGYITIYMQDKSKRGSKPIRVTYDFYARRIEKKLLMNVTTNLNASFKDNEEMLQYYGLSGIHQRVTNGYYEVDTSKIVKSDKR